MHVVLNVDTAGKKRVSVVRSGQTIRVGRTEWADLSLTTDTALSDVHFEITCDGRQVIVRDLSNGPGTLLNGEPVTEAVVRNGDQIAAGQSHISVEVVGGDPAPAATGGSQADAVESTPAVPDFAHVTSTADAICTAAGIDQSELGLDPSQTSAATFLNTALQKEDYVPATNFLAYGLPKRESVWWSVQCLAHAGSDHLPPAEQAACAAAEAWCLDPSEENRTAAGAAADVIEGEGAAGMTALGAFWSSGSILPPGQPEVPPDDQMTARGIFGAVASASLVNEAVDPVESLRRFVELGIAVADGTNRWPE